jgi:polar amino acid transport system substrate-binding protein
MGALHRRSAIGSRRYGMHVRRNLVVVAAAVILMLAFAVAAAGEVQPPRGIASAGRIVFCTDPTYPPEESMQGSNQVGSDIDIGSAIAKTMGVKAEWRSVGFDGIIAALLTKKCDAILAGMTDTAQRREQVDFAHYLIVGMSLMVKKGNPHHVTGLASLSGLRVAVELGTTEKDALTAENKLLAKQERKAVVIKLFNRDTDAAAALFTGKVDAYFADDPPVGYYVKKSGGKFEVAADRIQSAPIGVVTRKRDPLGPVLRKAISQLYADGTMRAILAKWGLSAFALKG